MVQQPLFDLAAAKSYIYCFSFMNAPLVSQRSRSYWSIATAIGLMAVVLGGSIYMIFRGTGGKFSYPVDDAYIHMQIAKNLAFHHTWGINADSFGSASSSPLYTILLASCFTLFGAKAVIPLLLNIIAGLWLLLAAGRWLQKQGLSPLAQFIALASVIFLTPLPLLITTGMEHTLQCLFAFLFLSRFAAWLQDAIEDPIVSLPLSVYIYAVLTATIRYEGLFFVAAACIALLIYKRLKSSVLLGFFSVLPLIVFGTISVMKGSYFLPNSVLVKSEAAQFSLAGVVHAIGNIVSERLNFAKSGISLLSVQRLLIILPLVFLTALPSLRGRRDLQFWLISLIGVSLLQVSLADTGKFYRYEAYIVLNATLILSVLVYHFWKPLFWKGPAIARVIGACLVAFLMLPIFLRATTANLKLPRAGINIYEQQYQMSRFLKLYYDTSTVAANDIGAIAFFTNARIVDLWGLGSIDIARSKKGGYWNAPFLDSISRKEEASIAIIYDSWIDKAIPPHWKKAGEWKIFNNVVCGDDHVSFYAIDTTGFDKLKQNLVAFEKQLPPTVAVHYNTGSNE